MSSRHVFGLSRQVGNKLSERAGSFAEYLLELKLLRKQVAPPTVSGSAHFVAPQLCCPVLQGHVCPHLAFRFRQPHRLFSVRLAYRHDKVRVKLARAVLFIIGDGEAKALVLQVPKQVFRAIEKVGKLFLQFGVTRNLVGMS